MPVCRYISGWHIGIATSSSICSMHASMPPRSERRADGGACSCEIAPPAETFCFLLLSSTARDVRVFRLPFIAVLGSVGGVISTTPGIAGSDALAVGPSTTSEAGPERSSARGVDGKEFKLILVRL